MLSGSFNLFFLLSHNHHQAWGTGKLPKQCDTLAASYVSSTSKEAGKSALQRERIKLSKYAHLAASGLIFMPVANETLGSWAPLGIKFIKEIGSRITEANGDKRATSYLFQSISIATQRGNAASIAGTIPSARTLDELYYL